ncbi:unnamed protein product [Linum trigynum]|uniref:Uncharacterized protein n=1 Tax=Linum trigynum TaxID=586398 RepID=A0AAV2FTD7_9ROSI
MYRTGCRCWLDQLLLSLVKKAYHSCFLFPDRDKSSLCENPELNCLLEIDVAFELEQEFRAHDKHVKGCSNGGVVIINSPWRGSGQRLPSVFPPPVRTVFSALPFFNAGEGLRLFAAGLSMSGNRSGPMSDMLARGQVIN